MHRRSVSEADLESDLSIVRKDLPFRTLRITSGEYSCDGLDAYSQLLIRRSNVA
jgi:hypothetical protein